jgi:aldehyde:ferredoxin oxidoreductase
MVSKPKVLASYEYQPKEACHGYMMRTLYVNLSSNEIREKPVSEEMKEKFTGGKGFDLWLLWNALPKGKITDWDDPSNEICIATGPLGGNSVMPGSGKSIAVSISPVTHCVVDSNVGGFFGPYLKYAGFDALEVQGKAKSDVVVVINGDRHTITIETAPELPLDSHLLSASLGERYGEGNLRSVSTVSAG